MGKSVMLAILVAMHFLTLAQGQKEAGGSVEVMTKLGSLRGDIKETGLPGRTYLSFRGVPYAQPPTGSLRFKDPVAVEKWSGVRESFDPPPCPQIDMAYLAIGGPRVLGEEDCLYVHVYTPKVHNASLPVMVFFHGGAFVFGYPGSDMGGTPLPMLTRDVVLVPVQYRLGSLGFLSTEDDVLPGNLGLKDQTMALRWVRDNIHSFGGDPGKVTIFGESAGGSACNFQMLAPSARGLFQRAILQSGTALSPWALRGDHRNTATIIGERLACPGLKNEAGELDSEAFLTCVQDASIEQLIMSQTVGKQWFFNAFYVVPRVDGVYLPDHPATLLREGRYYKVDVMAGTNAHEFSMAAAAMVLTPKGEEMASDFDSLAPIALGLDQEENGAYMSHRIFYNSLGPGYLNYTRENADVLVKMGGYSIFVVPVDLFCLFHSRVSRLFMYQLDHRAKTSKTGGFVSEVNQEWVAHGDDLLYLFSDLPGLPNLERKGDLVLREIMLDLWTNFAATGHPTPDMSLGFTWTPASRYHLNLLSLTPAAQMKADPRVKVREFLQALPTEQNKLLFPNRFSGGSHKTTYTHHHHY